MPNTSENECWFQVISEAIDAEKIIFINKRNLKGRFNSFPHDPHSSRGVYMEPAQGCIERASDERLWREVVSHHAVLISISCLGNGYYIHFLSF